MIIDGKSYNEDELIGGSFLELKNNIYISKENIKVLEKYGFDINNYNNVKTLIFDIEEYLNNSYDELDDLEYVSQVLAENNYYNNTNK